MKKIVAAILALTMVMSISITAFAFNENDGISLCDAPNHRFVTSTIPSYFYSNGGDVCITTIKYQIICLDCSATNGYNESRTRIIEEAHNTGSVLSAYCDGETQTHTYYCYRCKDHVYKYITCPGPTHAPGFCTNLPI